LSGQSAGGIEVILRKQFRCGRRADRIGSIFASQLNTDLLSGAEKLFLPIGHDATGACKEADFHFSVFDSFNGSVPGESEFRAVNIKFDPLSIRHIDHDPVIRHFITYDLTQFTGKEKGLKIPALVIEGGVAKYDHRYCLTWKGTRKIRNDL
jgi:hypothetical protein